MRALAVLALAAAPACRSAESWRDEADRQAYSLVQSRRDKLELDTGAFTIEKQPGSLRERLLAGESAIEEPLTLVECLMIAAENSREYQRQKEQLYLAALDLTLERWRFAIQTGGTLNGLLEGQGDEATQATGDANFTLGKLLGTGASIIGSLGLNVTRSLLSSDDWNPTSDISLAITQPLMAGFGERIVKEPLTQAERNLVYQVRAFERFRREFAFDVASRYYRILQVADEVVNQERNVASIEDLSKRNDALSEAGRLSIIEVGQAKQNELRSQNTLLAQQQRFDEALDQFKLFLGLPTQSELPLDSGEMKSLVIDPDAGSGIDEEKVTQYALKYRLEHMTALDRVDDAERRVYVTGDTLRAILDVNAAAFLPSREGQPAKYDFRDATWLVGVDYSFPWERLPQRNAYREAIINHEAAIRAAELSEDQIRADLRADVRDAAARRDSFAIQQNAVELALQRIEFTTLQLDAGLADTRDMLEAQDSLLLAQNALSAALIEYTLARLNLFLDMELLEFDASGIRVSPERLETAGVEGEAVPGEMPPGP
jgi:outer membrane protein TolC